MEVIFFEGEAQNSKLVGSKGMPNCTPRHDGRVKDMTLSSRKNIKESKDGQECKTKSNSYCYVFKEYTNYLLHERVINFKIQEKIENLKTVDMLNCHQSPHQSCAAQTPLFKYARGSLNMIQQTSSMWNVMT